MECIALGTSGTLYNYTVVHRSLPGVPTPFVSAVIDLDGGGSIKANLDAPAADLRFGMPVKAIFEKLGQVDVKGRAYFGFRFVPA
ncbi:MAG: putative nucleic-acid-binding protein [Bradyrhizobium sp.]|nr:putative nucleic-acid-binding protein [Bradyrhizobium sp.]